MPAVPEFIGKVRGVVGMKHRGATAGIAARGAVFGIVERPDDAV